MKLTASPCGTVNRGLRPVAADFIYTAIPRAVCIQAIVISKSSQNGESFFKVLILPGRELGGDADRLDSLFASEPDGLIGRIMIIASAMVAWTTKSAGCVWDLCLDLPM